MLGRGGARAQDKNLKAHTTCKLEQSFRGAGVKAPLTHMETVYAIFLFFACKFSGTLGTVLFLILEVNIQHPLVQ